MARRRSPRYLRSRSRHQQFPGRLGRSEVVAVAEEAVVSGALNCFVGGHWSASVIGTNSSASSS